MSDLVRRSDVIEALCNAVDKKACGEWLYTDEFCNAINAVPSAQPQWIPVTKEEPKLPCVVVCGTNENPPTVPLGIWTLSDEEHGEFYVDGRLVDSPRVFLDGEWGRLDFYSNRIIAWMPLPKLWEGADDE